MNGKLQEVVRADPDCRRFVYTGTLGASFWLDTFHPEWRWLRSDSERWSAAEFVVWARRAMR